MTRRISTTILNPLGEVQRNAAVYRLCWIIWRTTTHATRPFAVQAGHHLHPDRQGQQG